MADIEATDLPRQRVGQRLNYKEDTLTTFSKTQKWNGGVVYGDVIFLKQWTFWTKSSVHLHSNHTFGNLVYT